MVVVIVVLELVVVVVTLQVLKNPPGIATTWLSSFARRSAIWNNCEALPGSFTAFFVCSGRVFNSKDAIVSKSSPRER